MSQARYRWIGCSVSLCVALLAGCNSEAPKEEQTAAPQVAQTQSPPPQGGSSGGVTPLTPGVGPLSPVVGTEGVQGGGSATGTLMKDRARKAASHEASPNNEGADEDPGN